MALYLVKCEGPVEGSAQTEAAYLVLATKPHLAAVKATAAFADDGGTLKSIGGVEELIGPDGCSVSLACAGLSINGADAPEEA